VRPADWDQLRRIAQQRVAQSSHQLAAAMQTSGVNQSQVEHKGFVSADCEWHACLSSHYLCTRACLFETIFLSSAS
jgi:hypothetical protein